MTDEKKRTVTETITEALIEHMPDRPKEALVGFLDSVVFPWYNAVTEAPSKSDRAVRNEIAERLRHDFSTVNWINTSPADTEDSDEDSEEEEEEGDASDLLTPTEYVVTDVFSQSSANGLYDIRVIVAPMKGQGNKVSYPLSIFLVSFKPKDGETIRFFDS